MNRIAALGLLVIFTRVNGQVPAEWWEPTKAEAIAGEAARYDPGLMAIVVRNRGLDLSGYAGAVSLMRRGDLGRAVWVRFLGRPGSRWVGPFLVADCAGRRNFAELREMDRVIEFSAGKWAALGLPDRPVGVIVSFAEPWPEDLGSRFY